MGTLFHRGNKWGINYIDPQGKQIRRVISEYKEAAQLVLKKTEMDIIEGKYLDKKKIQSVLFGDFVEEFIVGHVNLVYRHPQRQLGRIRIVQDYFRSQHLDKIDTRMIRVFLTKKLEEVKPSTVNRYLSLLRCIFNRAIDWKVLEGDNPTKGIKKLPETNERSCFLTDKEQTSFLAHCHGITHAIVLTALQTGLRWNEIMNLKWSQSDQSNYIDFDNHVIVIHSALSKSKKSRFIPMSYSLQCELFDLKKTSQREYIFVNPKTGKPFNNIRKSFATAVRSAGLRSDITMHSLRHVFASSLVSKGVDLYVVQQLLGHSSPRVTQRYAHVQPGHFKAAIEEIDLKLSKIQA